MRSTGFAAAMAVAVAAWTGAVAAESLDLVSLAIDGRLHEFGVTSGPQGGASTYVGTDTEATVYMTGTDDSGNLMRLYIMVSPDDIWTDLEITGPDGGIWGDGDNNTGMEVTVTYMRAGPRGKIEGRIGGTVYIYPSVGNGYVGEGAAIEVKGRFEALLPEPVYIEPGVIPEGD